MPSICLLSKFVSGLKLSSVSAFKTRENKPNLCAERARVSDVRLQTDYQHVTHNRNLHYWIRKWAEWPVSFFETQGAMCLRTSHVKLAVTLGRLVWGQQTFHRHSALTTFTDRTWSSYTVITMEKCWGSNAAKHLVTTWTREPINSSDNMAN